MRPSSGDADVRELLQCALIRCNSLLLLSFHFWCFYSSYLFFIFFLFCSAAILYFAGVLVTVCFKCAFAFTNCCIIDGSIIVTINEISMQQDALRLVKWQTSLESECHGFCWEDGRMKRNYHEPVSSDIAKQDVRSVQKWKHVPFQSLTNWVRSTNTFEL
jgi:hypothetical protein